MTEQRRLRLSTGITLNVALAGPADAPPVMLVHGFPESHRTWRGLVPLLEKDLRLVMPDLRGFGASDKPQDVADYTTETLVADLFALADALEIERFALVGHDWGGAIAWSFAYAYPELVERLIVMNLPHPAKFAAGLRTPQQMLKSWYIAFFQIPILPELLIQLDDYRLIEQVFRGMAINQSAFTDADIEEYKNAFAKRGVLTSVINYYRNLPDYLFKEQFWGILTMPTLLIWGEEDKALGKELTYGTEKYVQDLRIRYIPNCSHWVQQEQPQLVNQLMREFLIEG